MTKRILLDTCILIDVLRKKPEAKLYLQHLNNIPFLSAMTVAELYAGVREGEERISLDEIIRMFHTIPVSEDIGKKGGLYRRQYGKSHGVELIDAMIAATAEKTNTDLVTLNKKHFPMISNIILPYQHGRLD